MTVALRYIQGIYLAGIESVEMKIVHFVSRDKFTSGYINFMKIKMRDYEHSFIILSKGFPLSLIDENSIYYIKDFKKIRKAADIMNELQKCDIVIVSGVWFDVQYALNQLSNRILHKTYLHFWGGDFYFLAENKSIRHIKWHIKKILLELCWYRSAGLIFLIDGEYEKYVELGGIKKPHYIAPMPGDPCKENQLADYRQKRNEEKDTVKILVGNSATETNAHIEVFKMLKNFPRDRIKVFVPLSYGDKGTYLNFVITKGKELLGSAFYPILDYMEKEEYIKLLSTMDIAVFNNNRQQAMGNISLLLGLGAKVFLRDDTTMWKRFSDEGYTIYPITMIMDTSFNELVQFSEKDRSKNEMISDSRDSMKLSEDAWTEIFERGGYITIQ